MTTQELGDIETVEKSGVVSLSETLHKTGLTFIEQWKMPTVASGPGGGIAIGGQKKSGKPLKTFSYLLHNPAFVDAASMKKSITDDIDSVTAYPVYRPTLDEGRMRLVEGYKVLVSDRSKREYSVVSDAYYPIQDKDIFLPVVELAETTGLKVVGSIHGAGTGVTTAQIIFANPEYKIPLRHESEDYMMAGITIRNSYGLDKAAYVEAMGIRYVCGNYGLYGDELGMHSYKHYEVNAEKVYKMTHEVCKSIIEKAPALRELVEKSAGRAVSQTDLKDLGWAVGLPPTVIWEVQNAPSMFERTIKTDGLTSWTTYCAFTAARTHMDNRILNPTKVGDDIKQIKRLLYEPVDKLVAEGRKKREEYVTLVLESMKKRGLSTTGLTAKDIVKV